MRGEYQRARTVAEQNLEAAQINQDPIIVQMAREALGTTMLYMGDLLLAEEQFTQEVVRYDLERERSWAVRYGLAPSCIHNMWLGHIKWLLGYPDQSSNHIQEALGIAKEVAHPFSQGFVLTTSCSDFVFP